MNLLVLLLTQKTEKYGSGNLKTNRKTNGNKNGLQHRRVLCILGNLVFI